MTATASRSVPLATSPLEADPRIVPSTARAVVVIPTYQEADNIVRVLSAIHRDAPGVDVLVVDDDSPDGTATLAEATARVLGDRRADGRAATRIEVIRRVAKSGLGAAYRAGFAVALERGYEIVVEMDADLSHDPAALPALVAAVDAGADLAIGSRYVPGGATPGWAKGRRLLSRAGNTYAAAVLGVDVADLTSGYRAYRAGMLRLVGYESTGATGYGFQIELAYAVARAGGRITEVPIIFTDRTAGRSKMSTSIAIEALARVTWWAARDRLSPAPKGWRVATES